MRNIIVGLALLAACILAVPAPTEAADLRGGAGVPSIQGWSWGWLDSLWSEVGKALGSFFPQQPAQGAPAPAARTWNKQGTGVDPNGPPGVGAGALAQVTCDPTLDGCTVTVAVQAP